MNPPPSGITALPNGQWVVTEDTHLSKWAQEKGNIVTDPHLFRFLRPYLYPGLTVWDIGANIGDHTRQYLDWGCTVVAVEPNPLAFLCLAHNCHEATCLNAAATDTESEPLRFMRLDNVGASRIHPDGDILVDAVVLDEVAGLPAPNFIKIDVEGFELRALKGMEKTIAAVRPLVYCEINKGALAGNGVTPSDIFEWFSGHGYKGNLIYPAHALRTDPQYDILFTP